MSGETGTMEELASAIANTLRKRQKASEQAIPPCKKAVQERAEPPKDEMILPPGVCEEAAKILHEFWETNSSNPERRILWADLDPRYQVLWVKITRIILVMYTNILLTDIHRFLNRSNGDLGAAFAKALRRYARFQMNTRIQP